jgi:hypothetical protein
MPKICNPLKKPNTTSKKGISNTLTALIKSKKSKIPTINKTNMDFGK